MHPTLVDWIGFHIALVVLLAAELLYARHQIRRSQSGHRTAIVLTIFWVTAALAFAGFLYAAMGPASAVQYLAGYVLEQTLSIDNLFVFLLLFRLFAIAPRRQPKVLFWGVAGAIVMRGLFIEGGLTLLSRFQPVEYIFGGLLLVAALRLLRADDLQSDPKLPPAEPRWIAWLKRLHPVSMRQDAFVVREDGRVLITTLMLALIAIECTDVVFALDSIPAVLSITRIPFLAYTSNIMAVIGLRSLYFLLIGSLARLRFLHLGLACLLAFAAFKILLAHWLQIGPLASLGFIALVLAITVSASLLAPRHAPSC